MFRLTRPDSRIAKRLLTAAEAEPLPECSFGSFESPAPGFRQDFSEHKLGIGAAAFTAAAAAIRNWIQYAQPWIEVHPRPPELAIGSTFAVAAHTYGIWSLNACRVYAVIDEAVPVRRFGYAYRTLARHVELGDAEFCVEHRAGDDSVWLRVRTVSRMNHPLTKLFRPLGIRAQRHALAAAVQSMRHAVSASAT